MKRFLIPLILVALALGLLQVHKNVEILQSPPTFVSLIQRVEQACVFIEAQDYEGNKMWSGSGVIISSDGIVLTAGHIVNNAYKFKIILPDGREFYSEETFSKPGIADFGIIKLDVSEKLPFSYLGSYAGLRKGQEVFVIGSPFGYRQRFSVMRGIISGLERDIPFFGERPVLQTDMASFPGTSGGPVYNMHGCVIAIHVGSRFGYDSIGIAVPVNTINDILDMYEAEQVVTEIK